MILRDYFKKVEKMLQERLGVCEYVLKTSHINAIAAAAYIVFG